MTKLTKRGLLKDIAADFALVTSGASQSAAGTAFSSLNPNPTLFEAREASEPYSRGQWDSALKATPHSPKGDGS